MKHFFLISFLSICLYCAAQQNIKETYLGANFKGKVKTVVEDFYNGSSIDLHKDSLNYKCKIAYNEKGQTVKFSIIANNGKTLITRSRVYDSDGREIRLNSSGKPEGKYLDSYDANHSLTEKFYEDNKLSSSTIHDNKGNISYIITYDNDGQIITKTTFLYDANNNPIQEDQTSLNGDEYTSKTSRKFDKRHNIIEERVVEAGPVNLKQKQTFIYDKSDNLIMRIDSNVIYIEGEGKSKMVSTQNDQRNKDIVVYKFQYSNFDKHHNWLKKIEYMDDIIDEITTRKIEYYP